MAIERDSLRQDPDIALALQQNRAFEERMERALRLIANHDRTRDFDKGKAACLKAFDAIVDGIKVFFSFVGNDSRFAFALLDSLNKADASNGLCRKAPFPYMFHRSESRAIGDVYSQQILNALRRTHRMFVVVPSDEAVSSFVDFEIGAFSVNKTLIDRLICIHHPAISTMEITKDYDQVRTTHDDLYRMFEHLFGNADAVPGIPPLWDHEHSVCAKLVESLVSEAATLRPKRARSIMLQFRVHLRDEGTGNGTAPQMQLQEAAAPYDHLSENGAKPSMRLVAADDLESRPVSGTDAFAEIFGWTSMPRTFGELTSKLEQKYPASVVPWKTNLIKQIVDIDCGTPPSGNYTSFQDFRGNRRFTSSVISFTKREEPREVLSVVVGLQEAIFYPAIRAPVLLEVLETAMRLTYRFRWEILERFQGRIEVSDIEIIENRLVAAEQELMYRGVAGNDRIYELFDGDARKEMEDMTERWARFRAPDRTGILDAIFAGKSEADADRLSSVLPEIRDMNNRFMLLAAPRFAELVREVWGKGVD